ncbi:MAG: hypothetical protein ACR2RV_12265, partial [Verrucomicrobiales bacterium]
ASLRRISDPAFSDEPGNWRAQAPPLGSASTLTYADWADLEFPAGTAPADMLEAADPDGDGLTNFGEYSLVLNPLASDSQGALQMAFGEGGDLFLSYRRRSGDPSINLAILQSSDLNNWQAASVAVVSSSESEPGVQVVQVRFTEAVPSAVFPRLMFRIEVSGP